VRSVSLVSLAVLLGVLAIYVWRARAASSVHRWFAILTFAITGWVLGIGGVQSGSYTEFWGRLTFVSACMMPATFLAFSRVFPATSAWPNPRFLTIMLSVGIVLAILSMVTRLIASDISLTAMGIQRKSGVMFPVFAAYFLSCLIIALGIFIQKWHKARGLARAQLQHLGTGLIILSAGGITTNLVIPIVTGSSVYSWLGPYFALPLVALVGHAIIRHRLMDLRIFISRGVSYALSITIASALTIGATHLIVPESRIESLVVSADVFIIAMVVLGLLSSPFQRFLGTVVDPYLYRGRIDYALSLREATHQLSRLMQPQELSAELRQILTSIFIPDSFAVLVRPSENKALELVSHDPPALVDFSTLASLVTPREGPTVLVVDQNPLVALLAVNEALRAAGVELVVTLGRRGQLLGAILLGPRKSGDAYFKGDLDFIESIAELASIALENALLYRQRIQMLEYSERLLESLDSAVVAIDVSGRITSFNPAAKKLLGLAELGQDAYLDALPTEIGWALALAITNSWHPGEVEVVIDRDSHGVMHMLLSTTILHDDQQRTAGALAVVTDLSAVKALERNQRRVEHFAIMARFYAGIAHEIRNPLAAISNLISMLPDRFDDPEFRDTAVRLLPFEVARIVGLADRLRLMAPSEGGKLNIVSLQPLLNDIVAIHSPAAKEQRIKISLNYPDKLPNVLGDPSQLIQLFLNLLRNAIEAMPDGGTVTIEAEHLAGRFLSDSVVVRVIDDGLGIAPDVRGSIFEPFFTTKPSGTGLGLSICREIADFHRARLTLRPRTPLLGTIAEVEFSLAPTESPSR
jgi:PAS domain S-box-containing protein